MIEKLKPFIKNNFSSSPKAKIMLGLGVVIIVSAVTFTTMRKTITVKIDGQEQTFVTYKGTVKDVLNDNGIELSNKDKIQPSEESKVSEDDTITIKRAININLAVNGKELKIDTAEDTIADMLDVEKDSLKEQGVEFVEGVDEISPALDTKIDKSLDVKLVKVRVQEEKSKETIDYDVKTEEDPELDSSVEEVRQEGATGEKEVTYKVVYKDDQEVARNITSTKVVKGPVTEVIAKGTRRSFVSRDGQVLDYKEIISCESTAYSGGGVTATGTAPVRNAGGISTIAVDPRVIPLGSLVYVEGYGKAIAADTGGAIKGNIIDVYMDSSSEASSSWGRRYGVQVYILAYPGEW